MTSRQVGLARLLAKLAFAGEGVVALAVLLGRGPDVVALVVAGILLASGLQVYGILRWPFARMLLEQVTRGAVLMSGLIVGIFWTIDGTRDVLQQWLAVFVAGGAGLLGLAILRYLDYQEREEELKTALAAFAPAADVPRQATDAGTPARTGSLLVAVLVGAWLARRRRS
jgi:MYXO-CTERM domain-containing protein